MHCGIRALDNPFGLHLTIVGYNWRKESRISFSGRSWKKIRAPSKKLFSTRMAPPKGRKQSREIGPRDFAPFRGTLPFLCFSFAPFAEIISNEITDRNNGIEKLEKKSFFFFFVGEKWSVALVRWQMIPNELNDHEKRSILSKEERDFSDTSIITLIKGWWIGRIGEIEGFTRVIWFNLRDGFCCLAMAAVNGIFGFVRYCE